MLLTLCEICAKVLSITELHGYNRRLMLSNEVEEPQPRCFACCGLVKNLLNE